jgi:hypothetical protein
MYQQTINNATPEAYVTRKKSRAKIYHNNSIYLQDGETFEIEMFNPKKSSVLAKISLNNQEISQSGFIIKPGQRVFIERFVDSNNKFVFKTYDVEDNTDSLAAISDNGYINIRFYDEYFQAHSSSIGGLYLQEPNFTITPNYYSQNIGIVSYFGGSVNTLSVSTSDTNFIGNTSNSTFTNSHSNLTPIKSKSIETGRVEKGEYSNQKFEIANGDFNTFSFKSIFYKILPISLKPIEGEDLKRYCTECGKSIKKGWKFCPSCSAKV